jgi:putative DNA primase/helicase
MNNEDFDNEDLEEEERKKIEDVEKLKTEEKIELIGEWFIENYIFKHFIKNDISIGLYKWNGYNYEPYEEQLKADIQKYAKNEFRIRVNTHLVNEVIEYIKRRTQYIMSDNDNDLRISFNNGILDWTDIIIGNCELKDIELGMDNPIFLHIPHELDIKTLKTLFEHKDVDIETEKRIIEQLEPTITNVFKQWVNDKWLLLYEIIGYILYPKYVYHKAIMTIGEGANGKSTYNRLLHDIVGEKNSLSRTLQELSNPNERFIRAELYNKMLNVCSDIPKEPLRYTGYFKMLTGEDYITSDRKYKEPISFKSFAKLVFSANELPEISDFTKAFLRRWILIEFPNTFEINEGFYESVFTEEKIQKIIAIGIWTFYHVLKRNHFAYEEEIGEKWRRKSDNIYDFIQTMIEQGILIKDPDGKIKDTELWELYIKYCEEKDYENKDKRQFTLRLSEYGITKTRDAYNYYYKGLRKAEDKTQNILG